MVQSNIISFPGLWGLEICIDPVMISIGGLKIYWYGFIIMLGIITAFFYALWRGKQERIQSDHIYDLAIYTVLFGVIGARLYYVLTTLGEQSYRSFIDVIAIWNGGLAIYGAIIAGAATIIIYTRIKRIPTLRLLDAATPGVMIAQAIGRWGNFTNGEAYGSLSRFEFFGSVFETNFENNPLRMAVQKVYEGGFAVNKGVFHPTFFYESVWNIIGFILIQFIYRKKKYNGQITLIYIGWYGLGRMFIEGLRTDSLTVGSIRISQLLALICFIACSTALIVMALRTRGKKSVFELDAEANDLEAQEPFADEEASPEEAPSKTAEEDEDLKEDKTKTEAEMQAEQTDATDETQPQEESITEEETNDGTDN